MDFSFRSQPVSSLSDWQRVFTALNKPHHWRAGRSAHSLATLFLNMQTR